MSEFKPDGIEYWACPEHPSEMLPIWLTCPACQHKKSLAAHDSAKARERRGVYLPAYPELVKQAQERAHSLAQQRKATERRFRNELIRMKFLIACVWVIGGIVSVFCVWGFLVFSCWLWERRGK